MRKALARPEDMEVSQTRLPGGFGKLAPFTPNEGLMMDTPIHPQTLAALKQISEGAGSWRELAQCLEALPQMTLLLSNEDWSNYFQGMNQALERKGIGNVKWSDTPEPPPLGISQGDGRFLPYVFSHSDLANAFAMKNGLIIEENGAYPLLQKGWARGLSELLKKRYGGLILDEGSDHRIVADRPAIAELYAQLTRSRFAELPELFLLTSNGKLALHRKGPGGARAFCYDSEGTAAAGLRLIQSSSPGGAEGLGTRKVPTAVLVQELLSTEVARLIVNRGLIDERPYERQDLEQMLHLLGKRKASPAPSPPPGGNQSGFEIALPPETTLVPCQEGPFLEVWQKLPEVPWLYLPIDVKDNADPGEIIDTEDMLTVANQLFRSSDGMTTGMVYTDHRLFRPGAVVARMKTASALEQFFQAGRVQGVSFNLTMNSAAMSGSAVKDFTYNLPYHFTVFRFVLPRLVGLVTSADPFARSGVAHSAIARQALKADQVYVAYHHAAAAREGGEALDAYYFTELDALMTLRLNQQVTDYLAWYEKRGSNPLFKLYCARALSLSGQPEEALSMIRPFLMHPELGALAWLEQGRAMMIQGDPRGAINGFDECLRRDPEKIEAHLGRGIAYRNLNYQSSNEPGLRVALQAFQKVALKKGYHASEAYFHMGTIYLALGRMAEGEEVTRKSLQLRDTGIARRNLIIFLHARGNVPEAYDEYQFLLQQSPQDAQGLESYFTA
ncbi:MAG: tetratricopeptide repeat protein [Candidatus Tectomicrobia bacterium]|uniref:Tetratricopeptide repeat protein n=1 Tax=Tectimicrobiota bacterium TaxID=2528274 RepID=A0A932CQ46_UNCTE|nr:tetratricopeptide repeat protein [Candidatus Tectomicrobia bacterium]